MVSQVMLTMLSKVGSWKWQIAGLAAGLIAVIFYLRRRARFHLGGGNVRDDEEKIESELSALDKLVGSLNEKMPSSAAEPAKEAKEHDKENASPRQPPTQGTDVSGKTESKAESKGEGKAEMLLKQDLKAAAQRRQNEPVNPVPPVKAGKESPVTSAAQRVREGGAPAETEEEVAAVQLSAAEKRDLRGWTSSEMDQYAGIRGLIGRVKLLLRRKEHQKAYVLYLKIRRDYDTLPKKIQMKISEEYSEVRSGINKTIPQLEVIDEQGKPLADKTLKEREAAFLGLLSEAETSLGKGEKVRAFILYSEIKGMYHLMPETIKTDGYARCVAIYKRCVAKDDGPKEKA